MRDALQVITAHRQYEGAGFVVRRPFPGRSLEFADPFLLLDELGPATYGPGEAVGAPDHPHRGFETVTYLVSGETEHQDSAGHQGAMSAGDVQWMTAGSGVVHSELPSRRIRVQGGTVHGFQLWVNLPARDKLMPPRYQEIPARRIPTVVTPDGHARARVIAGELLGVQAVIETRTPIAYHHWALEAGSEVELELPEEMNVYVYVFRGLAGVGRAKTQVAEGQLAVLAPGQTVRLHGPPESGSAELLLLGGVPLREPVSWYGPFVMNSPEEIEQAVRDFRAGRMGEIRR